ncbi:MAG TPA: ATP-dependent DNA helicase RecG [Burkholderiales bacterium]|nr:ATP-dependent DNA helicase RecG [Burkholderiales bacterium]
MRREAKSKASRRPSADPAAPNRSTLEKLAKLGIRRPFDLVLHLPLRYEDETRLLPIAGAPPGQTVQVQGEIVHADIMFRPRRQLVCQVKDASGLLFIRFLNFYPNQARALCVGARVRLFGEVRPGFFGEEMVHPRYRLVAEDTPLPKSLTPVYPVTAGLAQSALRAMVLRELRHEDLADTLPAELTRPLGLPSFAQAVRYLHEPPPDTPLAALEGRTHPAWRRMKFDELLAQQLSMRLHYRERRARLAPPMPPGGALTQKLLAGLPFSLTGAQHRALAEIRADLGEAHPMQRLLQGDVGSGKTVVAALAALQAVENGYQVAIMAPTEILAEQHYRKLSGWLGPLGVRIAWLAGSQPARERRAALAAVDSGEAAIAVGTQALFQEQVLFQRLGLAVIDEQHRFGVHQRLALRLKAGEGTQPHQLMMSATPIPRTLAMSYYADLDVSVIDELPPGRTPVTTKLLADTRRDEVVARVRDACMQGRQAYWVCPLIEESESLQLKTALETYDAVRQTFPELKLGLVHGRLAGGEKAQVMEAFQRGEVQLLVATTVIEVGVDVPNASLMVIEHAERMGLAQLHQLRGRVGRGADASVCILMYQNPLSETARERLKIIYETQDGFDIAREDLKLRGPGEFLGARQSGVPMLRFADLERDQDLLAAARDAAAEILRRQPEAAARHLERWLGEKQAYLRA